jgi:purine-binding chemotaxis protein CheW
VFEVTSFRHEEIGAPPDIGIRWRSEYIAGVVCRDGGFVVIVDLARLLSSEDAALIDPRAA